MRLSLPVSFWFVPVMLIGGTAAAQDAVVIYRCTDAKGALTVQNDVPCPSGSRQQKRVMTDAPTALTPAPTPTLSSPPPRAPSAATAPVAAAPPRPDASAPPVLFECRTHDNGRYLHDGGAPPERCVPLRTTGLDGSASAVGSACEMVTDQCQRIADGALCDGWRERLREAESALRFGLAGNRAAAQTEVERIGRILRESTCGL